MQKVHANLSAAGTGNSCKDLQALDLTVDNLQTPANLQVTEYSGLAAVEPFAADNNDMQLQLGICMGILAAVLLVAALALHVHIAHAAPCDDSYYTWKCADIDCIRLHESTRDNYAIDPTGEYIGSFQISLTWHKDKVERIVGVQLTRQEALPYLLDPAINYTIAWYLYLDNNNAGYPGYSHWRNSSMLCGL